MTSSQHGSYTLGYTHPTMAKNNELQAGNSKLISQISPQFRSRAAIRPREVGIASNRESAGRGEYVLASCTHRKFNARVAVYVANRLKSCSASWRIAKKTWQAKLGN
jgi:hypothetical protein